MSKICMLKRCVACIVAVTLCAGLFSYTSSKKENNSITVSAESDEARKNNQEISDTEKNLEDLKKKQKEIDGQINATQGDISKEEENQKAIQAQIDTVQKTIFELEKSISELNAQIDELQEDINVSRQKILEKQEEIDKGTDEFKERLRSLYIVGDDSYISMIAGATDFYDMLMKSELIKRVARHDKDLIDKLISMKAQFEEEKKELEKKKSEVEIKKNKLVSQQNEVKKQAEKLQKLMNQSKEAVKQLEAQKAAYKANQEQIEKSNNEFQNNLQKLIKKRQEIATKEEQERIRKAEEEARQSSYSYASGGNTYRSTGKGVLRWPVPGFYYISYGFGYRSNAGSITGQHNGIDIYDPKIGGHEIIAAADGEVIQATNECRHDFGKNYNCNCGGGYGRYCTIDHGNGITVIYGHQTEVKVRVGQKVKAGDVIGRVGSTGFSTGNHLHFEVHIGGVAVDPMRYLN